MTDQLTPLDDRIQQYLEAAERIAQGDTAVELPVSPNDEIGQLGLKILDFAWDLERRTRKEQVLAEIVASINDGLLLTDILEKVYESFKGIIPYNRIGLSLIEEGGIVRAYWAKTDRPVMQLGTGYSASLEGSTLQTIIETGQPRILNDLQAYLEQKPGSHSTGLIVKEGLRSSLTCPLFVAREPVGFIFFSSASPNTYTDEHVDTFVRIASKLSVIVEKGRLTSELAAQKEAVERQNKELEKLNELKNTFLGIAAHDLRNPLSTILLASEMLVDDTFEIDENEQKMLLGDIQLQTNYMLKLIDDLLDVTMIESGKLDLDLEPLDLPDFLISAVKRHARLAAAKDISITYQPGDPADILADSRRLRQVIDNLLSNAVKYSPPGSRITVHARVDGRMCWIGVTDEGPGIKPEESPQLFEYFSRASSRPTGGEKSTGLGLAISRRVIDAHGGKIGFESEVGRGSTFWFTLPLNH
ncbi:MAG: GAF domain-containing protein [Anaerolineae bacterium]|nr:GAF domain-containing protein [Anaerolineae bacterium]